MKHLARIYLLGLFLCISYQYCFSNEEYVVWYGKRHEINCDTIGLDTLQQTILRNEPLHTQYCSESNLEALCLRAFSIWAKKYTGDKNLKIKVFSEVEAYADDDFRILNLNPKSNIRYDLDDDDEEDDDEDDEDDEDKEDLSDAYVGTLKITREHYLARKDSAAYYEKYYSAQKLDESFQSEIDLVKPYDGTSLKDALGKHTIAAGIRMGNAFLIQPGCIIAIYAILPKGDNLEKKTFIYSFGLKYQYKHDFDNAGIKSWNDSLCQRLEKNPYLLMDGDSGVLEMRSLFDNFAWYLVEISEFEEKIPLTALKRPVYEVLFDK